MFVPNMEQTLFVLSQEPNRLEVIFRIEIIENGGEGLRNNIENDYTLAFIFTNPPKGGYSHASPQKIGHIDGKELYGAFHVEIMGDNQAYNLTYSFYVKEITNG
ncbi:DUF6864 domain-containing function [Aliivibrio fischeri]